MLLKFIILLSLTNIYLAEASRILAVIPTASYSHQIFFRPLWKELAKRGHEVVLVTTDPMRDPNITNLREIDISNVYDYQKTVTIQDIIKVNKLSSIRVTQSIGLLMTQLFLSHPEVKQLFKNPNEHFDLLMLETVLLGVKAFKHRFAETPLIYMSSLDVHPDVHEMVGNPNHMIQYPYYFLPFGEGMDFVGRLLTNAIVRISRAYMYYIITPRIDAVIRDVLEVDYPSVREEVQVDMVFANSNPLFNSVRPFSPATISLAGGLHEAPKSELPKDIKEFLDSAPDGVVYFSLGSNVKSKNIHPDTRQVILETLKQLPYKVLWKFEDDELPNKPENVMIAKWVPQQDVLRHKNIKLFITQGGLQSLEEAFYVGVPVVVMPYFGDQGSNARSVVRKGLGLEVSHRSLTVEDFKSAVLEVATNDKYKIRINQLTEIIKDEPMKPLEKAVWWTEYVLRHKGAQHLKGARIPMWQFYYLDIFAFIGVLLFGLCWVLIKLCCTIRNWGRKGVIIKNIKSKRE